MPVLSGPWSEFGCLMLNLLKKFTRICDCYFLQARIPLYFIFPFTLWGGYANISCDSFLIQTLVIIIPFFLALLKNTDKAHNVEIRFSVSLPLQENSFTVFTLLSMIKHAQIHHEKG